MNIGIIGAGLIGKTLAKKSVPPGTMSRWPIRKVRQQFRTWRKRYAGSSARTLYW